MKSPLKIVSYFFPAVAVAADPNFNPDNDTVEPEVEVNIGVARDEENDSYEVALEISLEAENEKKKQPYSISLVAIGIFQVAPDFPDPDKLLRLNGASIIYGAAREFIITITSRGPWGQVMLPSISFINQERIPEEGGDVKSADQKK